MRKSKIDCYCVTCGKFIGKYYPSQTRQTCAKDCYKKLASLNTRGPKNPNYRHGSHCTPHFCKDCGKLIDKHGRSERCYHCRSLVNNSFKGNRHTKKSRKLIGLASKKKFTRNYMIKIHAKHNGRRKHTNGYVLIKDYDHPNKNSQNDVLEHIKVMSERLGRPIKRGEIVHHINFIRDDNKISNLYLYDSQGTHLKSTRSLFKLVDPLLRAGIIQFDKGDYTLSRGVV